ncbi:MAG: 50S ribosomal protein L3 N(5)-glutamine methyltransferase [Venatoribacter sp.]
MTNTSWEGQWPEKARAGVEELSTIQDMLRYGVSLLHEAEVFFGHGLEDAREEAQLLIAFALYLDWDIPQSLLRAKLTYAERERIMQLFEERIIERVPVAYITGESWFCGLPFNVDERVLIPRSPIGQMLEQRFEPWWQGADEPARILDLCTGSGCIGIAAATFFPDAEVELLDISFDALEVAQSNIERHQLEDRVQAFQSDLFSAASGKYDLIISNPPYVDAQDMADLPSEYLHEPALALEAGADGLDLVRIMLSQARDFLTDDGLLVVEVGNSWPALAAAYPQLPLVWPSFERGGHGVFVLQAKDLELL